jgi:hypothetical protein
MANEYSIQKLAAVYLEVRILYYYQGLENK